MRMTSLLKQLLPLSVRNALRPAYRSLARKARRAAQSLGPAPASWQSFAQRLRGARTSADLYLLAQQEFGVLQQEVEIVGVLDYVAATQPAVIGEIGLKNSGNSFLFTQKFSEAELFVGVDLQLENVEKLRYVAPPEMKFRFFERSSYDPATVGKVARCLGGRKFDFLFIDGDHSWDGVREDFFQYLPLMRPGGLVGFHDIVPDELARHGKRSEGSTLIGGDVHAFWALLKMHFEHREFVRSWEQIGFGIGVITLPQAPFTPAQIIALREQLSRPGARS
jgi:cephalosporin hydroxylase